MDGARAEGETHGEFALSLDGARDEQAEAVETRDDENEQDGALEKEEIAAEVTEEIFAQRLREQAAIRVGDGISGARAGGDAGEFGLGIGQGAAGSEFGPHMMAALGALSVSPPGAVGSLVNQVTRY